MTNTNFNSMMQRAYSNYKRSGNYNLRDCYNNASYSKVRAYMYCEELCNKMGGYGLKIIGYNTCTFSVGFEYMDNENKLHFVYITKDYETKS